MSYVEARKNIARFIKVDLKQLTHLLYKTKIENSYSKFTIPKRDRTERIIYAPNEELKYIQKKLNDKLCSDIGEYKTKNNIISNISHGFEKGKGIFSNASIHRRKKYILTVDVKDFFNSFKFVRVKGFFEKSRIFNFSTEEAMLIAQLVCFKGSLPQGAPTSPVVANLIFNIVDMRIIKLAKRYKLNYSRYADDLTFSTNDENFKSKITEFIKELSLLVNRSGFELKSEKTRIKCKSERQMVTGLTVNFKVNAHREYIKKTRAMADSLFKNGTMTLDGRNVNLTQLEGRFNFLDYIDRCNDDKNNENKSFRTLNCREKQFQRFLFYKYFFNPKKPVIVTEGKTDIKHIKAALKRHYDMFPSLVEFIDGRFEYKVSFFKRSKRIRKYLGVELDGADTMINIWNLYTGKNGLPNIFEYLQGKSNFIQTRHPVVLLFDNEMASSKPLKKFLNITKFSSPSYNEKLVADLNLQIMDNLYLQTLPSIKGVEDVEIEDLYLPNQIMEIKDNENRTFKKEVENIKKNFGKDKLSEYIYLNYKSFDFSNFFPLLKSIETIIKKQHMY